MHLTSEEVAMVQDVCDGLTYEATGNKYKVNLWVVEEKLNKVWRRLGANTPEEGIVAAIFRGIAKYAKEVSLEGLENRSTLIEFVARGMSNKQIALRLGTSEGYVRKMLSQVYKIASVSGRHQLAALYAAAQIEP